MSNSTGMRARALAVPTALALLAAIPLPAAAGSPTPPPSSERPRPGPGALYEPPVTSPLLRNAGAWDAPPIMVSGAEAYGGGEYVYQDYLYDDHGADTTAGRGSPEPRPPTSELSFGAPTGDVVYPTREKRYGYNAADLLELRLEPRRGSLAFRFTLNTLLARGSTALAVGIDTDGGARPTDWGHNLGVLGPLDLEHVLYTDGVRAALDGKRLAVSTSLRRNQIDVRVPRSLLDPRRETWTLYAVTGIANGKGGFTPLADQPGPGRPGGAHRADAPPVFNVAFRFEAEGDEPMGQEPSEQGGRSFGYGHWREHGQARALARRDISAFAARVDFEKLAEGVTSTNAPRRGYLNRIYVSRLRLGEGVADGRPWLLGRLQPYSVYVPRSYRPGRPAPLQLVLHSLSATHNQFAVFSPNTYRHLAEDRGAIALTTAGRGPDGWYLDEAELDVFEAWADVGRHYTLHPRRVGITGYSMGGYGTFRLATLYPDLFGKAFPVVGPPSEGISLTGTDTVGSEGWPVTPSETNTYFVLENVRNIPFLIWNGAADELVPVPGTVRHAHRLHELGYRYRQDVFAADHFALAVADDWTRAAAFLGRSRARRNPPHVTFRVMPGADAPRLGLVHDHAYWVWGVRVRRETGTPATGLVDARSLAFGLGEPTATPVIGAGLDPLPHTERGLRWSERPAIEPRNELVVRLENVRTVTVGTAGARLDPSRPITLRARTDGRSLLRLRGDFAPGTSVVDARTGRSVPSRLAGGLLSVPLGPGRHGLRVLPGGG